MPCRLLQHIVSLIRNPPLMWTLSMTGSLDYSKIVSNHVNIIISFNHLEPHFYQ